MGFLQESQVISGRSSGFNQAGFPPTLDGKQNRVFAGNFVSVITPTRCEMSSHIGQVKKTAYLNGRYEQINSHSRS